jgi:hypothetical protein
MYRDAFQVEDESGSSGAPESIPRVYHPAFRPVLEEALGLSAGRHDQRMMLEVDELPLLLPCRTKGQKPQGSSAAGGVRLGGCGGLRAIFNGFPT